ncbi:hypothetical protein LALCM10_40021 [Dellaglioa algida]|nr:hypothetical protein LALCM10_40021 [Dellaglioa algida]
MKEYCQNGIVIVYNINPCHFFLFKMNTDVWYPTRINITEMEAIWGIKNVPIVETSPNITIQNLIFATLSIILI